MHARRLNRTATRRSPLRLVYSGYSANRAPAGRQEKQTRWAIAGIAATIALGLVFALPRANDVAALYANHVAKFLWLTLIVGVSAFHSLYGDAWRPSFKSPYFRPAIFALALTGLLFYSVGTANRIPAEESRLLSASQSLANGNAIPGNPEPAFVPFVNHVFHSLLGFNANHGFWVSFFACAMMLLLMIRFGEKTQARSYGVIGATVLAAFPLFALSATSSGADVMNALLVTAVGYQFYRFFQEPSLVRFELTAVLTLAAAQCNPASAWFLIPLGIAGYMERGKLLGERAGLRTIALPFLALPVAWYAQANHIFARGIDGKVLGANLNGFGNFFMNRGGEYAFASQIFTLLAVAGFVLFAANWKNIQRKDHSAARAVPLFVAGLLLVAIVQFGLNPGSFHNADFARLLIVFLPVMALCAAYPLHRLYTRAQGAPVIALLLLAYVCMHLPTNTRGPASSNPRPNNMPTRGMPR